MILSRCHLLAASSSRRALYSTLLSLKNEALGDMESAREEALRLFEKRGYDLPSVWEQPICWGDLDSFRHLNNVHYARFVESARIRWMEQLAYKAGGEERRKAIIGGKGVGLILKSLTINYRRPVVYPDTLLLSQRVHSQEPTQFSLESIIYSLSQRKRVANADSLCVWYDYEQLKKCEAPREMEVIVKELGRSVEVVE